MRLSKLLSNLGVATQQLPLGYNPHTDGIIRDAIPVKVIVLWGYDSWYSAYWGDAIYIAERLFVEPHIVQGVPTIAYSRSDMWSREMDGSRRLQRAIGRQIVLVQ